MGKRKRARSSSSSDSSPTSSSSSARTPSPPPPKRRKRHPKKKSKQVPRKTGTETVSTSALTLHNMIPEFDPLNDNVTAWLNIMDSYAKTFSWADSMIRYQALNKLKGSAKTWYDSLLRNDHSWITWTWNDWKLRMRSTFQVKRNMYELIKEIVDRKPVENQSLYAFFFEQKSKIDNLCLNFSDQDIISIIIGNIGDSNISASVEASNFQSCDSLAAFLHSRIYKSKPVKMVVPQISGNRENAGKLPSSQQQPSSSVTITASPMSVPTASNQQNAGLSQYRKPLECFNCGGNHKRIQCSIKCEFCGKRGHSESICFKKNGNPNTSVNKNEKVEKQETKFICSSNSKDKFCKRITIHDVEHDAFIDMGSSCSIIKEDLVNKYSLPITVLPKPVALQGFTNDSIKTVYNIVKVNIKLDAVFLENVEMYVLNELSGCDILVGRNITERQDLMYSRVGNALKFDYAATYDEFCTVVSESSFQFDYDSHHKELMILFSKYRACVATNVKELGKVNSHEMIINLNDSKPVQFRPYRASPTDRQKIREIVDELLESGIIRESNSPYSSPALLVNKKNGEKRLCIDYRALNKVTVKDKYPMPRIEDLIDRLQGCRVFTSLDLKSGYYQIKMSESNESISKTAFITEDGHYEFLRLPFGLANAPSCFQQMMHKVIGNLRFGKVIVYLDDVLIVSETVEENLQLLEEVLKIFKENGLTLNLKKCHFLKTEIEFLGYRVKQNSIMPSEAKVQAVKEFPTPGNVHQLRQFLGLISYFRKFIRNCAALSSPLTSLLKKDSIWAWEGSHEQAFQTLKGTLTSDTVLTIFDPNRDCVLYTDASRDGLAGILMQITDEGEKPIHDYSRQTTSDEKKYHSFELELLAIVSSLQKYRLYLLGSKFTIVTDCNAVKFAMTKKEIIPRIARWVLSTQEFTFDITHREGTRMQHVDALSRNPICTGERSEAEIVMSITEADWVLSLQLQDPSLVEIRKALESGEADKHKSVFNDYELLGNKVYKRTNHGRRWVVPKPCVWQVIRSNHDDLGHFALDKTVERIAHHYWFPKMRRTVKKYIKNCINCNYYKYKAGPKEGELYPLPKHAQPFHTIHMDHLGPFVKTTNKNKYLLVTVDSFTKFVFVCAVRNTDSESVIREIDHITQIFGNPRRIIADAGSAYTSHSFKEYCEDRNIRLHNVATGMPRSNGQVERVNRTILDAMKTMGADVDDDKWDQCVKSLQHAINSTYHKTIKAVPCEALLGYRLRSDSDRLAVEVEAEHTTDVTELRKAIEKNIKASAEYQKLRFDQSRAKAKQYQEGDLVLVKIGSQSNDGQSKKLLPVFKGPFQVKKVLGNDRYQVCDLRGSERCAKLYIGNTAAENMKPWINISEWEQ